MMPTMGDSSDDGEEDEERSRSPGLNLTGFLFGNINEAGQLEDDGLLDNESKRHLASLARLGGLGPLLREVMGIGGVGCSSRTSKTDDDEEPERRRKSQSDSDSDDFDDESGRNSYSRRKSITDETDYGVKSPSAVDYSDINEMAEDERTILNSLEAPRIEDGVDYDADDEDPAVTGYSNQNGKSDTQLMPPPPPLSATDKQISSVDIKREPGSGSEGLGGVSKLSGETIKKEEHTRDGDGGNQTSNAQNIKQEPLSGKEESSVDSDNVKKNGTSSGRRLETPLAAMLPSKYAGIDVTTLFPDFRPDKVLRFSRLFGPGKATSLPQIWRSVRKRRRKHRKHQASRAQNAAGSDSGSDQDSRGHINGQRGAREPWCLRYAPPPPPNDCASDDEERLLQASEARGVNGGQEQGDGADVGPRVADWRFGPAQIWYDMLDVPETGEGFNYGFKLKDEGEGDASDVEEKDKEGIPDGAFLMVSQLLWEDEVVWNGEDIKHKVLQKLSSKNNAAGWVPSSGNRTAQAFSQPGKGGIPQVIGGTVRLGIGSMGSVGMGGIGSGLGNAKNQKPQQMMNLKQQQMGGGNGGGMMGLGAGSGGGMGEDGMDDTWYSIFPVDNEELVWGKWEEEVIWDAEKMPYIPRPKVLTLDANDENIILGIPNDVDPARIAQAQQMRRNPNAPPPAKVKIPHPHVKKSKLLLGKAGVINVVEEEEDLPPPPKSPTDGDPFNVSNDRHYLPRSADSHLLPLLRVGAGGAAGGVGGVGAGGGCGLVQHSTPAVELRAPFVPTHMGPMRLRNFHRPPLKRYSHGALALPVHHAVLPLLKHIRKKAKQREQERTASGGGDVFFMRTAEDLTGKDGDLILVEFCEEHPPLMNQVGMCSKIKNYYKRRAGKDGGPKEYRYGEVAYAHTSPFLGSLPPGQSMQAVENNMYRAPIYEHQMPETDFLVIRTRQQYCIREIDSLFVAGQECPLYEVPGPNSKRANNFVRDFLQVFIYRLFWKSRDTPRRIKMDDIKKAFPSHSESSIRKRLKLCADFKRTGMDSNWWVIKPDFRLPSEEEIRAMVSPEQCCAYFSMIAAEQRLKDAGYGEKFLFTPQEDEDEEMQLKMDDEVKVAPWNTTRAYIQAVKGKCLLQLTGPADPTGCGEGFSYVRMPNKPQQSKEEQEAQPKRTVTGTDADLRRLSLNNAKALLRKFGVPEEEIKKLSRWEVIDVVRTLSTEKAKAGEEGMTKFSRGNRFSIAEHQERYKEECQRIFDLQNRVLSSGEVLSTDEGESSDEDSDEDIEEMGKNIENMLANKKTSTQLSLEKEEQERRELRKLLMGESIGGGEGSQDQRNKGSNKDKGKRGDDDENSSTGGFSGSQPGRVLRIMRTFRNPEGKEYTRVEIVRRSPVIDTYVRIRTTRDEAFIRQFATLDEHQKEEMKREKRRIQEQLRRIKRNQEKERLGLAMTQGSHSFLGSQPSTPGGGASHHSHHHHHHHHHHHGRSGSPSMSMSTPKQSQLGGSSPTSSTSPSPIPSSFSLGGGGNTPGTPSSTASPGSASKRKKPRLKPDLKLKCGACGQVGHMRTNKACPLYQPSAPAPPVNVAMTEEQEEEIERQLMNADDEDLVNVDGTKVKLSGKLLKHAEEIKRRSLLLKVPKEAVSSRKRRRAGTVVHCDYLKRQQRPANRRRTDPVVVLSSVLESILNEMRDLPDVQPFLFPVNAKSVPDYYKIVTRPMDLQSIRDNLRAKKYQSREEFLADVNQIVENSTFYNGAKSSLTVAARRMLSLCVERLGEREERLMRLEKAINPLLDDDDQVALTFILDSVVNDRLKAMSESWPFLKPVNKKFVRDYYSVIKEPMDLETVAKKVKAHKYHNRHEFLADIELILQNCIIYNGKDSVYTKKAETLYKVSKATLDEYDEHLTQLERSVRLAQERALEQADMDSLGTSLGPDEENYTIAEPDNTRGSQDSSPDVAGKSHGDDYEFVDVEGEDLLLIGGEYERHGDGGGMSQRGKGEGMLAGRGHHQQSKGNDVLAEDLQFSSEEDDDLDDDMDGGRMGGGPAKRARIAHSDDEEEEGQLPDDDSQQAAEAMVQLGNLGYYPASSSLVGSSGVDIVEENNSSIKQEQEESMDVDPNYDPSDFLMQGLPQQKTMPSHGQKLAIQDDLAVSESDEEEDAAMKQELEEKERSIDMNVTHKEEEDEEEEEEDDGGSLWF